MLEQKMQEKLNEQINAELYAAYLYQAMGAYFEDIDLDGFATWMDLQTQEEEEHARKIYDYINQRGGRVKLKAIEEPPFEWDSPLAAYKDALEHEQKVTAMINDLVDLADELKDRASYSFLQWFVDEQVEEEDSVNSIVERLKMIEGSSSALMMMNDKLGQRTEGSEETDGEEA